MRTMIIYASKHGATAKCARMLAEQLQGEVEVVNLETDPDPDLTEYDTVVLGGPIYAGKILEEVRKFAKDNLSTLLAKKLGLFICGLQDEDEGIAKELANSFPAELLEQASVKSFFGGELYFSKMGRFERWMMKKMAKSEEDISEIRTETISSFARTLSGS